MCSEGRSVHRVRCHARSPKTADLFKDAELKVYTGQPHGLTGAHEQEFNADLLAFARA